MSRGASYFSDQALVRLSNDRLHGTMAKALIAERKLLQDSRAALRRVGEALGAEEGEDVLEIAIATKRCADEFKASAEGPAQRTSGAGEFIPFSAPAPASGSGALPAEPAEPDEG